MKKIILHTIKILTAVSLILPVFMVSVNSSYIKWVDFDVTYEAMSDALKADTDSWESELHYNWIELLSVLAVKNGGNFKGYKKSQLDNIIEKIDAGKTPAEIAANEKLYNYYIEAYNAVLGGFVGEYDKYTQNEDGSVSVEHKYGLRVFSPLAKGYYYNHYDDFGASRSYGYQRPHLGHDLVGSVGTPVIAVESGYVEAVGWNQYGGWRIGIRSHDNKRYYYYAHLRKNHPYNDIYEGKIINAGEVIGYLGMTGYSSKENTNNIEIPHLHYGMQLIFDPSQKDGVNQIWIDMYAITNFLSKQRAEVYKNSDTNEYYSRSYFVYPDSPD